MKVLHIGIKNWPLESDILNSKMRGGGSVKYCDLLINNYSDRVLSYIITKKLKDQNRVEINNNNVIYRINTFGGRKLRVITLGFFSFFHAIRIIQKEKIDILHGHILTGIFTAFLLGRIFKIPVIATPYSIITYEFSKPVIYFTRIFEKHIYKSVDKLIFETYENRIQAQLFTNQDYHNSSIINTGIDVPSQSLLSDKTKNREIIRVLFLGRLVNIKCIDNLILSLEFIDPNFKNRIHLDIVGEGELFPELSELVSKNNLSKLVSFHGYVEDTSRYYQNADIFVLPSEMEGLSISLLEAMSYGLACIVNNFKVPFNESTVFVLKDNKPETIAYSLEYFIKEQANINRFGHRARETIISSFTTKKFADKYIDVYRELLSMRNK